MYIYESAQCARLFRSPISMIVLPLHRPQLRSIVYTSSNAALDARQCRLQRSASVQLLTQVRADSVCNIAVRMKK